MLGVADAATVTVPGMYPSIQAAVQNAPDGSIIEVAPGHYHGQVVLENDTRSLTLRGDPANPSTVVIDGDQVTTSVIRLVNSSGWLTLEGVTIMGGHGATGYGGGMGVYGSRVIVRDAVFLGNVSDTNGGGAMIMDSAAVFQRCVFQGNRAGQLGGAVTLLRAASPTAFQQCQFVANEAGVTDPTFAGGGAVYAVNSSPILDRCLVQGNRSAFEGGGVVALATYDYPRSVFMLRDTTIAGNVAYRGAASSPGAEGGGMHIEDNVTAVLERCRIEGNRANLGGGLMSYRGRYEITDSVIEDNVVASEGTPDGGGGGIGAASTNPAAPARDPAAVFLTRSVVRRNTAETAAGIFAQGDLGITTTPAIVEVSDSLITDNTSSGGRDGGGMLVARATTTVRRSMVLRNSTGGNGGGIAASEGTSLTIDDVTIGANLAASAGGGLFIVEGGTLAISGSRLVANQAQAPANAGGSGAIFVGEGLSPGASPPVTGSVTGSVIAYNGPDLEIAEPNCDPTAYSQVTYVGNTIHTIAPLVYSNVCSASARSVAAFNAIQGKASGNVDVPPSFAHFIAAPGTILAGTTSVLAWSVAQTSPLSIDNGVGPVAGPLATTDVSPAATATYTLTQSAALLGAATVDVRCGLVAPPLLIGPGNGAVGRNPGGVHLEWLPAVGASAYDVYLDMGVDPATAVAQDLAATSVTVGNLAAGQTYRWKVLAKTAQCADPVASTTFAFQTCADGMCEFVDGFDDGDASDWSREGAGKARVVHGRFVLGTRRVLTVRPPFRAFGGGTIALSLGLPNQRSQARLLFGYHDARTYRELAITGAGRVQLVDHAAGRRRVSAQLPPRRRAGRLAGRTPVAVRLELAGADARVFLNGSQALSGSFAGPSDGTFAVRVVHSSTSIDDVHLVVE